MILGPDGQPLAADGDDDGFEDRHAGERRRLPGGLSLRALAPNAITSAALCSGLTGIRFATDGQWDKAVLAVILAGLLDGIDGRVARAMNAQSRFGAELDSLADNVSFGVAPALILFMWSLHDLPRLGWLAALTLAVCCALRLARFNARIDLPEQPHKSAGFLTGVPAPVGAGLAFFPMYFWIAGHDDRIAHPAFVAVQEFVREPLFVTVWTLGMALLMISSVATLSWTSLRPRRTIRLEIILVVGLLIAALLTAPWWTLVAVSLVYLALIPLGIFRYRRIRRQRGVPGSA